MKYFIIGYQGNPYVLFANEKYFLHDNSHRPPVVFQYQINEPDSPQRYIIDPLTADQQMEIIKHNPKTIRFIKEPSGDALLYVKLKQLVV